MIMRKEKDLYNKNIFTAINYFYCFFMGNLYFALLNIPLMLLLFMYSQPDILHPSLLEIFLFCLPIGPALTALMGAMGKLLREKDVSITKDYFKMYKISFKQSLLLWTLLLTILMVLYVDIKSVKNELFFLFLLLFVLVLIISFYMFPIISRFYLKTNEVIIMSVIYAFTQVKTTLLIITTLLACYAIFNSAPGISILFIISLLCYGIMYCENNLLKKIENSIE